MCYHDAKCFNQDGTSATFAETASVCKAGGTKVVIDLKIAGNHELEELLGLYIKNNNLQQWVVIQTNNQTSMQTLNDTVGSKLEYWGLVKQNESTLNLTSCPCLDSSFIFFLK